jgi:hypothetical protein
MVALDGHGCACNGFFRLRARAAAADLASLQPSVVNLSITAHQDWRCGNAGQRSVTERKAFSSGFIDPAGVIVTNRHTPTRLDHRHPS